MGLEKTVTRVTLEFSMVKRTNKQKHLVGVWNDHWHDSPSTAFCIFETHPDLDVRTKSKQSCVLALGRGGKGNRVVGSPAQKCWREWWELSQRNGGKCMLSKQNQALTTNCQRFLKRHYCFGAASLVLFLSFLEVIRIPFTFLPWS